MKHILPAIRIYIFLTVLTGLIYPALMTGLGQSIFPKQSQGSLISENGQIIGSELIAQKFTAEKYFWPRPSAVDYNPVPSGGSNLSSTSQALLQVFGERVKSVGKEAPQDMLFASGSGLDPHISVAAAEYQIPRIAKVRALPEQTIRNTVEAHVENRQLGFIGEQYVNVLLLNLALDQQR